MTNKFRTCLLVEDDPEDRDFFVKALLTVSSRTGVYTVSNGEEALTALIKDGIRPDYIFTDIQMPRMNGFEFIREIRSLDEFRTVPIIVYSSLPSEDAVHKLMKLGARAFYSKGSPKILHDILRQYFGEHRPVSIL